MIFKPCPRAPGSRRALASALATTGVLQAAIAALLLWIGEERVVAPGAPSSPANASGTALMPFSSSVPRSRWSSDHAPQHALPTAHLGNASPSPCRASADLPCARRGSAADSLGRPLLHPPVFPPPPPLHIASEIDPHPLHAVSEIVLACVDEFAGGSAQHTPLELQQQLRESALLAALATTRHVFVGNHTIELAAAWAAARTHVQMSATV